MEVLLVDKRQTKKFSKQPLLLPSKKIKDFSVIAAPVFI